MGPWPTTASSDIHQTERLGGISLQETKPSSMLSPDSGFSVRLVTATAAGNESGERPLLRWIQFQRPLLVASIGAFSVFLRENCCAPLDFITYTSFVEERIQITRHGSGGRSDLLRSIFRGASTRFVKKSARRGSYGPRHQLESHGAFSFRSRDLFKVQMKQGTFKICKISQFPLFNKLRHPLSGGEGRPTLSQSAV
jgi:hypothetical protein